MSNIQQELLALRKSGGYLLQHRYCAIECTGKDASAFLQTRLSNNVAALNSGQGQMTALLDRKAHVLAYMSLHRIDDRFLIICDDHQCATILSEFEKYHFNEKVSFAQLSGAQIWLVQGPRSTALLDAALCGNPSPAWEENAVHVLELWQHPISVIQSSPTGESGFLFLIEITDNQVLENLQNEAKALNMVPVSEEAFEVARIEAGLLVYGKDLSAENILPETGLENTAASYTKGCFQGQEVLARLRAFGATRRGLVGLVFETAITSPFAINSSISLGGEEIGVLKSCIYSPTLKRVIAFACVQREYRTPGVLLDLAVNGTHAPATVIVLPFYSAEYRNQEALKKYNAALAEFASGSEDRAIQMLREAIELDPKLPDAYEALGVMLSRRDELDEAIELMKTLEQLAPDSIMAHTNLSVFYMQQGNKELAEDEKAKALSIRMSQMASQMVAEQRQKEEIANRKAAAEQRISMFQQVLAIDSDDFLALSGIGGALVDNGNFKDALPHLHKALSLKPNHTVTYLALGEALEQLGRQSEAIQNYERGIAVAAQRGDITPMKEMQARLSKLTAVVN